MAGGGRLSVGALDLRGKERIHDGRYYSGEDERADEAADDHDRERRVESAALHGEREERPKCGYGGQDDRKEARLTGLLNSGVERNALLAELVGEVDEENGVLNFHADKGDEANCSGERERVAGEPEGGDAADEAKRDDRGDDKRAAKAAELEYEDGEDSKRGDKKNLTHTAEAIFFAFDLAGKLPAKTGGPT